MNIRQVDMTYEFGLKIINAQRFPVGWVTVEFADEYRDLPIQQVMLHLPMWEVYRKFNIPVESKHILYPIGPVNKKAFTKMVTRVYTEIFPQLKTQEQIQLLKDALWRAVNYEDDFGCNELNEYHCSISLVDLALLVSQPEVKEIIDVDLDETKGTRYIEQTLNTATEKIMNLIGTRGALKHNVLLEYQEAGILNRNQLPQVIIAFGLRTEINDKVIRKPIKGSSLRGMRDICELGIEQQGARKTVYYSHTAIQTSQYWGRKQQLLACSIQHLYPGDCGTTVPLPVTITAANSANCIGKYILDNNGNTIPLLSENINDFIDCKVNMWSPITCKHTDGVCEKCYGLIGKNLPKGMNIGINAASQVISIVSQLILSTKHYIKTDSRVYIIPTPANNYLERSTNGIYFKKEITQSAEPWEIGFSFKSIRGSITDLHHMSEELPMPEERYSEIEFIFIRDARGNITPIELAVENQCPYLTKEFFLYMKSRYDSIHNDESIFWVPMQGCKQIPIFRTTIDNSSMMGFVMSTTKFLENGVLTKYKDASAALQAFTELIYDKVSVNIVQLEILLKAHLVTSKSNYSIPVITDPHNVMFAKTVNIVSSRTLSSMLALQGLKRQLSTPYVYTRPRDTGPFDLFFGI